MKQVKYSLEELAIQKLKNGPMPAIELIAAITETRHATTKQGVYRVLRKLKAEEKIVWHGKTISLNLHWLREMNIFFALAQFQYSSPNHEASLLGIKDKDKIVYSFKNLDLLDVFWGHAFHMLILALPASEPVYIYNPHEWFAYGRSDQEQTLITILEEQKRPTLLTIVHNDPLNQALRQKFSNSIFQYYISSKSYFKKDNYYCNIFGDYIIEVYIDENIHQDLDVFFKNTINFENSTDAQLSQIIHKPGHNKLVISRNHVKAEKLRSMLKKNFFIKKRQ